MRLSSAVEAVGISVKRPQDYLFVSRFLLVERPVDLIRVS